jgi:hypothetical protein
VTKKLAIVGLIVLLVLLSVPLGIGIVMDGCPACPPGAIAHVLGMCLGLLATVSMTLAIATTTVRMPRHRARMLLLARRFEHPPRSV